MVHTKELRALLSARGLQPFTGGAGLPPTTHPLERGQRGAERAIGFFGIDRIGGQFGRRDGHSSIAATRTLADW